MHSDPRDALAVLFVILLLLVAANMIMWFAVWGKLEQRDAVEELKAELRGRRL